MNELHAVLGLLVQMHKEALSLLVRCLCFSKSAAFRGALGYQKEGETDVFLPKRHEREPCPPTHDTSLMLVDELADGMICSKGSTRTYLEQSENLEKTNQSDHPDELGAPQSIRVQHQLGENGIQGDGGHEIYDEPSPEIFPRDQLPAPVGVFYISCVDQGGGSGEC